MSPRPARAEVRAALLKNAARLLSEEGPSAMSTRRLAVESNVSTTAVYTYFGSMSELIRSVVREGFDRLDARLALVPETADVVLDQTKMAYAYRVNALTDPHVYRVMFGGSSIAGFQLSLDDRKIGVRSFRIGVEATKRAIEAGAFDKADPGRLALRLWSAIHGHIMLDINGYFFEQSVADRCFDDLVRDHLLAAGCDPERRDSAVRRARRWAVRAGVSGK